MWSQTVLRFAAVREKGACQDHSENCFISRILSVRPVGTSFPFHGQDEIVAQMNMEEKRAIVGRRVMTRGTSSYVWNTIETTDRRRTRR